MLLTCVPMKLLRERAGEVVGALLAPVFNKISEVRRARTFHPDGMVFEAKVDQAALHFSAFNDGKGIVPRGFVHAIRLAVYPASQEGRPAHS